MGIGGLLHPVTVSFGFFLGHYPIVAVWSLDLPIDNGHLRPFEDSLTNEFAAVRSAASDHQRGLFNSEFHGFPFCTWDKGTSTVLPAPANLGPTLMDANSPLSPL